MIAELITMNSAQTGIQPIPAGGPSRKMNSREILCFNFFKTHMGGGLETPPSPGLPFYPGSSVKLGLIADMFVWNICKNVNSFVEGFYIVVLISADVSQVSFS